jgi:hypothetical protein
MKWREAIHSLEQYERSLRKLMSDASADGDYASVLRIADLAKAINGLAAEARSTSGGVSPLPAADATSIDSAGHAKSNGASSGAGLMLAARRTAPSVEAYPKFFRRGDELVKVGWSKKERKEYNHRASRRAVDATAAAIKQVGAKGKLFNGEAILPLKDATDGSAVPGYQAYVALAWLTRLGVVEQHGVRGGYTLATGKQDESAIAAAWPELVEWRGQEFARK